MGGILISREDAEKHSVVKGDTLLKLATEKCESGITWEKLAWFNFGTVVKEEVNLALQELIGVSDYQSEPKDSVLDPDFGPSDSAEILLPKYWQSEALALNKRHTIKLKTHPVAPRVVLNKVDKWFIPADEVCDMEYRVSGKRDSDAKVHLDIYASNYCKATATEDAKGFIDYDYAASSVPIRHRELGDAIALHTDHLLRDWKGESEATEGVLKPRKKEQRYINVASSPYTANVRRLEDDADKDARIEIDTFWPIWSDATPPVVEDDSLKIRWNIHDCDKLTQGLLLIFDKENDIVLRKGLPATELSHEAGGWHEFNWSDGKNVIEQDKMPYRVQIQAHSEATEEKGVALAAMQTEVRMYAHSDLGSDADPLNDPQCLKFNFPPYTPDNKKPKKNSAEWIQYQLAAGGFPVGPIDGDTGRDETKAALKSFQRNMPANKRKSFNRIRLDGTSNRATKRALGFLDAEQRKLFGHADADPTEIDNSAAEIRLRDKTRELIVWVDDRNYYTQGGYDPIRYIKGKNAPANGDAMALRNYHGGMSCGDGKVGFDSDAILRPWVGVEVEIPLMSKSKELDDTSNPPTVTDNMRASIGPIRVDWSFKEAGSDLTRISVGATDEDKKWRRARKWTEKVIGDSGYGTTEGTEVWTNCPETVDGTANVGIRPADNAEYYKAPFGFDSDNSLQPWKAYDDTSTKTVCSVVHDDLGQDSKQLYKDRLGRTGIFLRPSTIGGDGYQFRAQVSFDELPGAANTHPNFATLKKRYPKRAQSWTAKMRVWRRTTFRGHIAWAKNVGNWQAKMSRAVDLYRESFVEIVDEAPGETRSFTPNQVIKGKEYVKLLQKKLKGGQYDGLKPKFSAEYVYPFLHLPHYGIRARRGDLNEYWTWFTDIGAGFETEIWDEYSQDLILLLISKIEKSHGRFAGHLIADFASSTKVVFAEYQCDNATCTGHAATAGPDFISEVISNIKGKTNHQGEKTTLRQEGKACKSGCGGKYTLSVTWSVGSMPLSAIGRPLGGAWLYVSADGQTWAHEMGHHRHLEHADGGGAGGAKDNQHDHAINPNVATDPKGWDRYCLMSYDHDKPQFFCGKCLLKNRGWPVESITDPAGAEHD